MNSLFILVFAVCGILILIKSPEQLFTAMLGGGEKAALLCAKLLAVYAVCMGIIKIAEDCGLMKKLARLLAPLNRRLFMCDDQEICGYISGNIAANMLGMGGVATPMGISAMNGLLRRKNSGYTTAMFFVINAAGLQLLPLSVIALRSTYGSALPSDILLPGFLATLISVLTGVLLVKVFVGYKP